MQLLLPGQPVVKIAWLLIQPNQGGTMFRMKARAEEATENDLR